MKDQFTPRSTEGNFPLSDEESPQNIMQEENDNNDDDSEIQLSTSPETGNFTSEERTDSNILSFSSRPPNSEPYRSNRKKKQSR